MRDNKKARRRRPVQTSFIVGLGILICFIMVMIVIANISSTSDPAPYFIGALSGALALAGSVAYLLRRLGLGAILALVAALVLFILGFVTLSQEGSRGDFYGVWFTIGALSLIVAGLIWSCQRQDVKAAVSGESGADVEDPVFRADVKPRRIRDLNPADFPGADPQTVLAWQRAVKTSNWLVWPLVLGAIVLSMAVLIAVGIIPSFLVTTIYLFGGLSLLNSFPARHLREMGLTRGLLQQACNKKNPSW